MLSLLLSSGGETVGEPDSTVSHPGTQRHARWRHKCEQHSLFHNTEDVYNYYFDLMMLSKGY